MNRNNAPGLGQWITVSLLVVVSLFLLYKLYQYAGTRTTYPTGLTIGGVDVSHLSEEEARARLSDQYLDAPVELFYNENSFNLMPGDAEFVLNFDAMFAQAERERTDQDFYPASGATSGGGRSPSHPCR